MDRGADDSGALQESGLTVGGVTPPSGTDGAGNEAWRRAQRMALEVNATGRRN